MGKYPDIGILDAIYRLSFGTGLKVPREKIYKHMARKNNLDRVWFSKKVYYLKKRGFLQYGPTQELILTKSGVKHLDLCRLENLKLEQKSGDGRWRVIIFDIPEKQRSARDLLRAKLNEFRCYQLQKSVYLTLYECEKEIREISTILGLSKNVHVITAESIGSVESEVRKRLKPFKS
jgi:CRISPR/Cas system-associated endoribonuclease Cas2